MAVVCPTVTATEPHLYREQLERVAQFAKRIHIDLADGVFAPTRLMDIEKVWWPEGIVCDIHLMYEAVIPFLDQLIELKPDLVIVHAESVGNFYEVARPLQAKGIKAGVAILQHTPVSQIKPALKDIDHVLIFSGDLGHFGGTADLDLLEKVKEIRKLKPDVEIGWDGGINADNVAELVAGGIDVLNAGGFIQRAAHPETAYAKLKKLAEG